MTNTTGIGARVRAARERLAWTREALAFRSGLSWAAIAQVESGRRTNLRPTTLSSLSRALGLSIDYLVGGTPSLPTMLQHSLFPYHSEVEFRTTAGAFLAEGIERSEALIAVTTKPNVELLREELGRDARRVKFVHATDFYGTPIGALQAYRDFADAELERGALWVRVLGEPVWDGRTAPDVRLWTRYEALLNLVFGGYPLTVVCPYDERSVPAEIVAQAHLTHPRTVDAATSSGYTDPERFALES